MKDRFVSLLVCPRCRNSLGLSATARVGLEVVKGTLRCDGCGSIFRVRGGIPRMVVAEDFVRRTQGSFGAQWQKRVEGRYEDETLFGLTAAEEEALFFESFGMVAEDLKDKTVLDGGCGSGRLTRALARHAREVVGIDVASTIDLVARAGANLDNLHLVQGSLLEIPLADEAFDVVWSMGVIHHTGDTPRAFANLARVVSPGGTLYVWVYSSRNLSLYKVLRDAMRISHRLPEDLLFYLCYMMAPPLKLYHWAKFAAWWARGREISPRERRESRIRTIAFELHDDLAPPYQTRHTPEELVRWFRAAGFSNIEVVGEVGVRGEKRS